VHEKAFSKAPLFDFVLWDDVVIDVLHDFLRVGGKLINLLIQQTFLYGGILSLKRLERMIKFECGVNKFQWLALDDGFEYDSSEASTMGKQSFGWPNLNGVQKERIIRKLKICDLFDRAPTYAKNLQELWTTFINMHDQMKMWKPTWSAEQFREAGLLFRDKFLTPTIGDYQTAANTSVVASDINNLVGIRPKSRGRKALKRPARKLLKKRSQQEAKLGTTGCSPNKKTPKSEQVPKASPMSNKVTVPNIRWNRFETNHIPVGSPGYFCKGLFTTKDFTPYMHALVFHVHELIARHGSLMPFSCYALEKSNHIHQQQYYRATNHGGGVSKKSALIQIMKKNLRINFNEYCSESTKMACPECNQKFKHAWRLCDHTMEKHNIDVSQQYAVHNCRGCSMAFVQRKHVKTHESTCEMYTII
jgi:hypothetical protein